MSDRRSKSEIIAELAEEFIQKYRMGERPSVGEYMTKYPNWGEEIRSSVSLYLSHERDSAIECTHSKPVEMSGDDSGQLSQIGDFRIIREVGRGGMGIVYEAKQLSLGRHVALKVLPHQMLPEGRQKRRFEREARSAAKLHHTNIVPVFGVGESDGQYYYAMQYIEGLGLDEVLKELRATQRRRGPGKSPTPGPLHVSRKDLATSDDSPSATSGRPVPQADDCLTDDPVSLPPDDATLDVSQGDVRDDRSVSSGAAGGGRLSDTFSLSDSSLISRGQRKPTGVTEDGPRSYWHSVANVGVQVASALQYAHEQGVLHRDVKPSNLLLDTGGTAWVLDFGLAKASDQQDLTQTGDIVGTLRYMPPEALEGQADARSDIYSLGLTLYELLALQPAFGETGHKQLLRQVTEHDPARLDKLVTEIPRDLVTIVHKAINRDPECRYQTARELADDLQRFVNDEPIRARRTSTLEHVRRWAQRNRGLAASVATIVLLLLAINIAGPILTLLLKQAYDDAVEARNQARMAYHAEVAARNRADEAEREAIRALGLARQKQATLYQAQMNLAGQAAAESLGIARVRGLTSAWRPAAGEEDLRDWEWFYLHGLGRLEQETLVVEGGSPESIAWSPDGSRIVYGQDDGTIVVWDVTSKRAILHKNLHDAHVLHVSWSADGTKVASMANQDKYVRVWDPLTGREIWKLELTGPNDWSGAVSFSCDGGLLAADSRNEVAIWSLETGRKLRTLDMSQDVRHVAWSPSDHRIAASSRQDGIVIWNGTTGELLARFQEGSESIAWDPHGERLAFAGSDRRVHILDLSSGEKRSTVSGHTAEITALAWNKEGTRLASAGRDTTVRMWDSQTGVETACLRGHTGSVTSLAWNPTAARLATGARDRTVKIWDTDATDERLVVQGSEGSVDSVSWGPDSRRLVASTGVWTYSWDADQGAEQWVWRGCRSMLSPVGQQIALGCGSSVEIRDVSSGKLIHTLRGHSAGITALAWNAQGTLLASASWDGTACIWNMATGKAQKKIELSHQDREICWSPDGEYLATIGNRDVQIWNALRGTMECQYRDQHQIHAVAWSPDGRCVASGGWGNDITVWDAFTADAISVLTGHTSPVTSLCWNPSGTRLASASEDRFVRIWDVETRGELLSLRGNTDGVTSLAWSQDGMRIAAGDRLGQVIVWDALPGHLCEVTPQALDVLNRRVEAHPTLYSLATRADFLDKLGRAEEAREDRRRLRLIREEQTEELLTDPIAVQSLADGLWRKIQSQDAACWRTLSPIRMTASSGATFTLEPDQSIFVTGPNTEGVSYDIYVNVDTPVAALRLEAIPDARLPHGGSGRAAKNGNFHLAEIDVYALQSADSETGREIAVDRYLEDEQLSLTDPTVGKAIDGNNRTHWDTYPNHKEPHWAVFQFAEPLSSETGEVVLRVRLDSGVSMWGPHGLGRFRLSATNDIDVVKRERMLQIVKTRLPDGAAFLGGTYAILGEKRKAAPAFAAALRQAEDPASRRATVAMVAQFDEVAVEVAKLVPNDPWLMLFQADLLADRGERERARQKREEALALLLEQVDENPETTLQVLNEAAVAYQEAGCLYESLQLLRPSYEQSCRLLSDEHMQTLSLLDTLADVLVDVGRCEEARTLREEENSLRQKVLGPDHRSVLASGQKLAGLYARCGQISEAVSLHVRIAEAAPLNDMNATQQAAFFLTWQGDAERHATLARTLLESARGTDNAKVARDAAKAILINPDVSPDLVEPAAALAKKGLELAPANTWSVLSLGMGDYRRGDFSQATTQLSRALDASSQRLRLLAHAFLAMAAFQRDDSEAARKHLRAVETGIGLIAFTDLESPFALHHDDLAVWLALREARRTMHIKPLSAREAIEGSLEFQREVVRRSPGDTRTSLHLAVLYAWFKKEKEHSDLCQQLLTAAEASSQAVDQERAAKAYLIQPSGESLLLPSAAASAETAVRRLENNDELRAWARMAAGMAAYRQQRYAEAVTLLTAAQESTNRFIRGPSLFFRSLAQLREGRRTQAIQDSDSAKELMQPFPNRLMVTEHILHHDQLVFWLAYDEAKQEFATAFARRDSSPKRGDIPEDQANH